MFNIGVGLCRNFVSRTFACEVPDRRSMFKTFGTVAGSGRGWWIYYLGLHPSKLTGYVGRCG